MDCDRIKKILIRQTSSFFAYLFLLLRPFRYGLNQEKRNEYVVVSMTSYRPRLRVAHMALKSLLYQTFEPDKIILYIENKDSTFVDKKLKRIEKYGITIEVRDDMGLGPHKKYYYATREYPQALVITVDDDMIYRRDLVELLVKKHKQFPDAICAKRVHRITLDSSNNIRPYKDWEKECRSIDIPSFELCATTGAGTLYPSSILPEETYDAENIIKYAPSCDDIWLKFIETANGIKVVRADGNYDLSYIIQYAQNSGLRKKNIGKSGNDDCINVLSKKFNIEWEEMLRRK